MIDKGTSLHCYYVQIYRTAVYEYDTCSTDFNIIAVKGCSFVYHNNNVDGRMRNCIFCPLSLSVIFIDIVERGEKEEPGKRFVLIDCLVLLEDSYSLVISMYKKKKWYGMYHLFICIGCWCGMIIASFRSATHSGLRSSHKDRPRYNTRFRFSVHAYV